MMRKDRQTKSKQLTPKLKQIPKQPKECLAEYLCKIENELSQFLVDNFSSVLENAFDSIKYYNKIMRMFTEFKTCGSTIIASIFKKLQAIVEPLAPNPPLRERKKSITNSRNDGGLLSKLESELRSQNDLISRLTDQNIRLKVTLKTQLQSSQEDRMKQNRMTELLYILRKRHIDIDRIYEQNCETPGLSKKQSPEDSQNSSYLQQNQ